MKVWKFALMAGAAAVLACDEETIGPEDANVGVHFNVMEPASGEAGVIEGSNGTLEITDVRMITDELALATAQGVCDNGGAEPDCQTFAITPQFVNLSLTGNGEELRENIEPGSYVELTFAARAAENGTAIPESLLEEIRDDYPDWPLAASTVVEGVFTPTGGDEQPFIVFLSADQNMTLAFAEPFEVTDAEDDRMVAVLLDLETWFGNEDGTVLDLSQFDFEVTGELLDLQTRFQDGFSEVEVQE